MKIFLTGFMASGKSTYGKTLAECLEYDFLDTDTFIEVKEQKSITEIFMQQGERYFRNLETRILNEIIQKDKMVVATGGGLIVRKKNWDIIRKNGLVIFLKEKKEVLFERILASPSSRPLLALSKEKDRIRFLEGLYKKRINYYREADLIINPGKFKPEYLATYLISNKMA